MNNIFRTEYFESIKLYVLSAISIFLMFCSLSSNARNLQILLVPESPELNANQQKVVNKNLPGSYVSFERGLSLSLSKSSITLIDKQSVFPSCVQFLCGEQTISSLMKKVESSLSNVNFIVFYSLDNDQGKTSTVRLIEPISYRVQYSEKLSLIEEVNGVSILRLGQDMGQLIETNLANFDVQAEFNLQFEGFLFEELDDLSPWLLANSGNSKLVLNKSTLDYVGFGKYFATFRNDYSLLTPLNASQTKQLLAGFFRQKNIEITISFFADSVSDYEFTIARKHNPYIFVFILLTFIVLLVCTMPTWYLRRRYLDHSLNECEGNRNAERWLASHKKTSLAFYGLQKKWSARAEYWIRSQKESVKLVAQANIYFNEGDVQTAKLFLRQSLDSNSANKDAIQLQAVIEKFDEKARLLISNEQLIKNYFSQAMNEYGNKQITSALQNLYEAKLLAEQDNSLKSQVNAIEKTIIQISQEHATNVPAVIVATPEAEKFVLCQNNYIHIGRRLDDEKMGWINTNESLFFVNHKSVSRVGQQCTIKMQDEGFVLIDCNSKNGTFINRNQLVPHQAVKLNNNDVIHLGGCTEFMTASFKVNISQNESLLSLSHDMQSLALIDKAAFNKIWPDNSLAIRSTLVCLQQECSLILNRVTNKLEICELADWTSQSNDTDKVDNKKENKGLVSKQLKEVICIVKLGANASIKPFDGNGLASKLTLNSIVLKGEVPLVFPCTIKYEDMSLAITEYQPEGVEKGHYSTDITSSKYHSS